MPETPSTPSFSSRLAPTVIRLGWISFFMDIAGEMAYPVLPLFLAGSLMAPASILGIIEGSAEAIVNILKGITGWQSDKLGQRHGFVRWGYTLAAGAKPLLALAASWPFVLLARLMDRAGKGIRTTARDAWITDLTPKTMLGRAYGFHRMMDTAGAFFGVMLSVVLLWAMPGQYRWIFWIAAAPAGIAALLAWTLGNSNLAEAPVHAGPVPAAPPIPGKAEANDTPGFSPAYWKSFALLLLFAVSNSSDTFLILRARDMGLPDPLVILLYALFNLVFAMGAYPVGILSDKLGRWRMMAIGWSIYAFVYFGFAWGDLNSIWFFFPLYGLFSAFSEGVGKAIISEQAPAERRGTAIGLFHMGNGLTMLAASLIAGWLWDAVDPSAPFVFGGTVAAIAVVGLWWVRPRAGVTPPAS